MDPGVDAGLVAARDHRAPRRNANRGLAKTRNSTLIRPRSPSWRIRRPSRVQGELALRGSAAPAPERRISVRGYPVACRWIGGFVGGGFSRPPRRWLLPPGPPFANLPSPSIDAPRHQRRRGVPLQLPRSAEDDVPPAPCCPAGRRVSSSGLSPFASCRRFAADGRALPTGRRRPHSTPRRPFRRGRGRRRPPSRGRSGVRRGRRRTGSCAPSAAPGSPCHGAPAPSGAARGW